MSQCTSPQIFTRIGLKNTSLATKASHTAHPSTGFKAHTHSCHPPHLTSQALPWTYNIHDPNMSNLSPELRTFSRQFTDSQHVHIYSSVQVTIVLPRVDSSHVLFLGTTVDSQMWPRLSSLLDTNTLPNLLHLSTDDQNKTESQSHQNQADSNICT